MPKALRQKTKKLYYNQYPFKVATLVKGGGQLRFWDIDYILERFDTLEVERLNRFVKIFDKYRNQNIKIRYGFNQVNFFLKDRTQYESVLSDFSEFATESWETCSDAETDAFFENHRIMIVDQLPHKKYTHKIIFKSIPVGRREQILTWLKRQSTDYFKISKTTEVYLSGKRAWAQKPFVLVTDPKMVTMMTLSVGDFIQQTVQYVLRSSINTGSQD